MFENKTNMNRKTLEKIIAAAYRDSNFLNRLYVQWLAANDESVRKVFDEYRTTADAVKALKTSNHAAGHFSRNEDKTNARYPADRSRFIKQPLLPLFLKYGLAVIAMFLIIRGFDSTQKKSEEHTYSNEEILAARQEAREALRLVGEVFAKSGNSLKEEILPEQVAKPIKNGITTINFLFKKGNSHEKLN